MPFASFDPGSFPFPRSAVGFRIRQVGWRPSREIWREIWRVGGK
jgi:hypothetical protein